MTAISPTPAAMTMSAERIIRRGLRLSSLALVGLVGVYVLALAYTPIEAHQGAAQKIFYLHVPAAVAALLAFSLVGAASVLYLWLQDSRLDRFAAASAEVGVVLCAVVLITGPIWGKPIWGTWWTWDARLTLTLFEFFLFVGYIALRTSVHEPSERARFSAVVGIMGMLLVPFIHLSVYIFPTLHPKPIVFKPSEPSLPAEMLWTLGVSVLVFIVLYVGFVTARYGLALRDEAREAHDAA
jgi:heme exporter protein C